MASAWNIVHASKYSNVSENDENNGKGSPLPDKFLRKTTMNSIRMSLRRRVPLKRMNCNVMAQQNGDSSTTGTQTMKKAKQKKLNALVVEKSVKKTFYKVTEQFTGSSKKTELKDTPQKKIRTSYREKLRSPASPPTPKNPFDSPSTSTPIHNLSKSKRYQRRTSSGRRSTRKTPAKHCCSLSNSDEFSQHLEMVSCGIQNLEANASRMHDAICHDAVGFSSTPLRSRIRASRRNNHLRNYAPITSTRCDTSDASFAPSSSTNTVPAKLRRTMSRRSMRVKSRQKELRSTKSTSHLPPNCYVGPLGHTRKLAPLQPSYDYSS